MFVQVIEGQVSNAGDVRAALDRWQQQLAPSAREWLGTTAGVSEDGRFVALVRFATEDAARRNSDRPEQGEWWAQTAKLFDGEPTFRDGQHVVVDVIGDPDEARFVQLIQGRSSDPQRDRELATQDSDKWAAFRPDIIGSVLIQHQDGEFTMALYFTTEEEAREGEQKDPPPDLKAQMVEMMALSVGDPTFVDLKDPWLISPR